VSQARKSDGGKSCRNHAEQREESKARRPAARVCHHRKAPPIYGKGGSGHEAALLTREPGGKQLNSRQQFSASAWPKRLLKSKQNAAAKTRVVPLCAPRCPVESTF